MNNIDPEPVIDAIVEAHEEMERWNNAVLLADVVTDGAYDDWPAHLLHNKLAATNHPLVARELKAAGKALGYFKDQP